METLIRYAKASCLVYDPLNPKSSTLNKQYTQTYWTKSPGGEDNIEATFEDGTLVSVRAYVKEVKYPTFSDY